jgi:hypothetical protein
MLKTKEFMEVQRPSHHLRDESECDGSHYIDSAHLQMHDCIKLIVALPATKEHIRMPVARSSRKRGKYFLGIHIEKRDILHH